MQPTPPDITIMVPSTVPWPPILLAVLTAGAVLLSYAVPLSWPGEPDLMARIAGRGLGIAGLALMAWSAWTLRRHATTIHPGKPATTLVTDGPFRWRRNPIYIAHVLMLFGIADLTQNVWFVVMAFLYAVLVTWLAILPEERHLEAQFGEAYLDYKKRTRRWI